ncbi:hypothetical protein NKJ09_32125 [Mesorhizobium sp. M0189]|uniref:hypothetical protein n=1 Tax=Mesorhizobium sp. M0189 TaxID=2956909 RepID=UPI0033381226
MISQVVTNNVRRCMFDCFHYAYAKAMRSPLLTLDELLLQTDVAPCRKDQMNGRL